MELGDMGASLEGVFWVESQPMSRILIVLTLCSGLAVAQNPFDKAAADKKASDAFQNLKVLNDDPSTSVRAAMIYFNTALGVECAACHDLAAFDKDTKNQKKTAREMITMTREINKTAFKGQARITCYTCHQGHEQPTAVPTIPKLANTQPPFQRFPQGQAPKAEDIVAKYQTALGGADKWAKIKTLVIKGSEIEPDGKTATLEMRVAAGDKVFVEVATPERTVTEASNGKDAWGKAAGQGPAGVYHLSDELAPLLAHEAEFYPGSHVLATAAAMRAFGITKVGDRDAIAMVPGQRTPTNDRLFFDKETGMLLRQAYTLQTPFGALPTQIDYADYRNVDGVQIPFKVTISRPNGSWTRTITSVQQNATVADSSFEAK
jgi:photosynthetic reaction center cytochrome c subunit